MQYYEIDNESIRKHAPSKRGVYFLGNRQGSRFVVRYVGRSDGSIRRRLLNHNHKDAFDFFGYQVARTRREAFMLETEYFYLFRDTLMNKIHPDAPEGLVMEHPSDTLGRFLRKQTSCGVRNDRTRRN